MDPKLVPSSPCAPRCPGWAVFNIDEGGEIQRCDTCWSGVVDAPSDDDFAAAPECQRALERALHETWVPIELLDMAPETLPLSAMQLSVVRFALQQAVAGEALFDEQNAPAKEVLAHVEGAFDGFKRRAGLGHDPCEMCGRSSKAAPVSPSAPKREGSCRKCGRPFPFSPDRAAELLAEQDWTSMSSSERRYLVECKSRAAMGGRLMSLPDTLAAIASRSL